MSDKNLCLISIERQASCTYWALMYVVLAEWQKLSCIVFIFNSSEKFYIKEVQLTLKKCETKGFTRKLRKKLLHLVSISAYYLR